MPNETASKGELKAKTERMSNVIKALRQGQSEFGIVENALGATVAGVTVSQVETRMGVPLEMAAATVAAVSYGAAYVSKGSLRRAAMASGNGALAIGVYKATGRMAA